MAALPPAGVSLEAQGFNKYIKQLDAIDKAQQETFGVDSRQVTKAFNDATKAASKYEKELKSVSKTQRQFSQGLQGAATGLISFATGAVVQFGAESAKLSAQFKGQQVGLENLAASFGQSGSEIQSAIQKASRGSLSGLDAITAANQGLLLGVAQTPEEFANLTNSAVTLGRTLGLDAPQAIDQFTSALGRQSLLILDNFGISAKQVNAEIERLAQADFGKARSELTEAQKQATFMKAALSIAGDAAATIGEEAGKAQESFDQLSAASENLQVTFGALIRPLGVGISEALTRAAKTAQQFFAFLGAGFTGVSTIATGVLGNVFSFFKGEATRSLDDILDEAGALAIDRFKDIASTIEGVSFPDDKVKSFNDEFDNQDDIVDDATNSLKAYQSVLKQAENLQLSFARSAEDAALKLARANEDIARKQAKAVADLEDKQKKERAKLLEDQIKALADFEKDREKQIAKAEGDIKKARKEAAEQRKRDQQKLHRDLAREQERFNLSQLQSERRFKLSESRLRAEGDILALKELREDRALERLEEKENFDLSKKEQINSAKEQQKEQSKDLENKVKELKEGLEDQRAELLASFDEQLRAQEESQAEATALQQQKFADDKVERDIALAREEEDRRISQRRQLEDLGRSFAEQEGVTIEGTEAIADQLEKIFGMDGTASNIMSGFTATTESEFKALFEDLKATIVNLKEIKIPKPVTPITSVGAGGFGGRLGGVSEFQEGGVVPGPIGSPQLIRAHAGEIVLPTHQSSDSFRRQAVSSLFGQQSSTDSFRMAAPVIPSQNLNVNMSGGFNVTGDGQADERILQAAAAEMTENFRIAVNRLARRN